MDNSILLAVDTTSNTDAATSLARDLALATGDRVVVLHVHEFAVGRFGRMQVDCIEGDGERVVREVSDRLRAAGVAVQEDIRKTPVGRIARTISAIADELDVRMIIVGSASTHDLPMLPFGSVSLRLLHAATKPVLIAPKAQAAVTHKVLAPAAATA